MYNKMHKLKGASSMSTDRYLKNSPLVYVTFVLKFTDIPKIPENVWEQFHEFLMDNGYPERVALKGKHYKFQISEKSTNTSQEDMDRNVFISPTKTSRVDVSNNHFSMQTTAYTTFEVLKREFLSFLTEFETLTKIANTKLMSFGIRYVNLLVPENGETLSDYINITDHHSQDVFGDQQLAKYCKTDSHRKLKDNFHIRFTLEEIDHIEGSTPRFLPGNLYDDNDDIGLKSTKSSLINMMSHNISYGIADIDSVKMYEEEGVSFSSVDFYEPLEKLHENLSELFLTSFNDHAYKVWS